MGTREWCLGKAPTLYLRVQSGTPPLVLLPAATSSASKRSWDHAEMPYHIGECTPHVSSYTLMEHIIVTANYGDVFILFTFFLGGGPKKWKSEF